MKKLLLYLLLALSFSANAQVGKKKAFFLLNNSAAQSDASPSVNAPYNGLISHWSLEGNGRDYYYGVNDGKMLHGTMTPTTGKVGNAYTFSSGGLQMLHADDLSFGDGAGNDRPFSYSLWIYPTETAAQRFIVSKQSTPHEYAIFRTATGKIGFILFQTVGIYLYVSTDDALAQLPINNWYHIVCTYDGSKTAAGLKIFINGVDKAVTSSSAGSYTTGMPVGASTLCIGNTASDPVNATNGFRGKIDEVTVFPFALQQAQIDLLYNSGNGVAMTTNEVVPITSASYERGLSVLATRGTYQFATDNTYLYWSDDSGKTWINQNNWGVQTNINLSVPLPIYNKNVDFAYIFSDGTLIFSCGNILYRTTDKLVTINPVTVYESDGVTPYTIHTPSNAARGGNYFSSFVIKSHEQVNGSDILVWGNYANNLDGLVGAAPLNLWYTIDNGATVKIAYEYGQNPNKRDDGSVGGGATGTLLGDAGNALYARHFHGVRRRPGTLEWYSTTGDTNLTEIHWLKHTYDADLDTWSTSTIVTGLPTGVWFVTDIAFDEVDNTKVYFIVDSILEPTRGLWYCDITDIGTSATRIYDFGAVIPLAVWVSPNAQKIAVGFYGTNAAAYSNDAGSTFTFVTSEDNQVTLFGSPPDSRNYLALTSGGLWFRPRKTIFVKQ